MTADQMFDLLVVLHATCGRLFTSKGCSLDAYYECYYAM